MLGSNVSNTFDTNQDSTDGCEGGCAPVAYGTCTVCATDVASGCREVKCNDGRLINSDGDAANGCETAPAASSAPAPSAPAVAVDVSPSAELSDASTAHITIAVITLSTIVVLAFF